MLLDCAKSSLYTQRGRLGSYYPIPTKVVHVHTSLFVAVLPGLYFTVSTSVDPLYRQRFFDPLIADVAVSLAGRDAYLALERN